MNLATKVVKLLAYCRILESETKLRVFSLLVFYQKSGILKLRNYSEALIHFVMLPLILCRHVILGCVPKVTHRFRIGNLLIDIVLGQYDGEK